MNAYNQRPSGLGSNTALGCDAAYNTTASAQRLVSEIERELTDLGVAVTGLHEVIELVTQKLAPVLHPLKVSPPVCGEAPAAGSPYGQDINDRCSRVRAATSRLNQLLESLAV